MFLQLGLIIIILSLIIYFQHMLRIYSYWKRRGVIGPTPYPVVGNYSTVIFGKETEGIFLKRIYEQYPNEKYIGLYKGVRPVLLIKDPDVIKCVLVRDYDSFTDRCIEKPVQVFKKSLFVMKGGPRWLAMRLTLSPSFTRSKIFKMIPYIQKALDNYLKFVDHEVSIKTEHEICDLKSKCVTQIIAYLYYGLNLDPFHGDNDFQNAIRAISNPILLTSPLHTASYICPTIINILKPLLRRGFQKGVYNTFYNFLMPLIYQERENKTVSPVFIDTLLNLKERSKMRNGRAIQEIDDDDIVEQMMTVTLASNETTATILSFIIYELTLNQAIQEKCFKEVRDVFKKYNGELTSEAIIEMKYLEMIMDETLRLHSLGHYIDRKCVSEYTFPNTNITIDTRVFVYIPTHGLQRDPKYFSNPNVFDPERFSAENKVKIPPYVYMPFGVGPRNCLGTKTAKVVVAICLASFLHKFKVTPSAKTKQLRYDPSQLFLTSPLGGVWVNIERRNAI